MEIIERIRQEREWKNEKILSWFRFSTSFIFSIFDVLAYRKWIQFTQVPPNAQTLFIDFTLLAYGASILVILHRREFMPKLKYFIILADYLTIVAIFQLDATVPTKGSNVIYIIFMATIYIYLLNLLRYSVSGTVFAMGVAILFFEWNRNALIPGAVEELLPMRIALLIILFLGYAVTRSQKEMMKEVGTKKMMESYLSPELVSHLDRREKGNSESGRIQNVTILFSDIRSFTSISEKWEPSEVVTFLNEYLSLMTEKILERSGTIDKFIGDAIFATFGINGSENKSLNAILSAIQMQDSLSKLKTPIRIGIGIHTGDVIVGNIGSEKRFDFTAIGDSVNLASRIESLTKKYNCGILVSQATIAELPQDTSSFGFVFREIDRVRVQGKEEPVTIYEILPIKT